MEDAYFVYVLQSEKTGAFYKGQIQNLSQRLSEHSSGRTQSIKSGIPWKLIYSEKFSSRSEAVQREKYFKSAAGRKFLQKQIISVVTQRPSI